MEVSSQAPVFSAVAVCSPSSAACRKEIEERRPRHRAPEGQVKLQGVIKSLEKDIMGLQAGDPGENETIQDKSKGAPPSPSAPS